MHLPGGGVISGVWTVLCVFALHVLRDPVSVSNSLCQLVQEYLVISLVIVCIFKVLSIQLVFVGSSLSLLVFPVSPMFPVGLKTLVLTNSYVSSFSVSEKCDSVKMCFVWKKFQVKKGTSSL